MQEYIEKLHKELHEIMERPVTLGRAEEVMVYADTICALHKLGDDHFRESTKMMEFTEDDAKAWKARMKNADGSTGRHWNFEQTEQVRRQHGYDCDPAEFYAAINMMYSDYYKIGKEFNLNSVDFYAAMAHAFLDDEDAGQDKLAKYYECIVEKH